MAKEYVDREELIAKILAQKPYRLRRKEVEQIVDATVAIIEDELEVGLVR